ncbi:MAG: DUF2507 domain-containing protein [Deltaproteobacteria bacterium]|nr:DUF2507 domain-containing protein [Deltaproteobacteria bacterium]
MADEQKRSRKKIVPLTLENALTVERETLGTNAPVALYRLVRLVALEEILGTGASAMAYLAGKRMGKALGLPTVEDFLKLCKDLSLGVIEVPFISDTEIKIDVYECVTCSGMTPVGRTLCSFEGGLIAGVFEGLKKRPVVCKEVSCIGGLGHNACGFEVTIRE